MWRKLRNIWRADNLLEQAWEQSYEMLQIDQEMFLEAVQILRERDDASMSREIRERDKIVNEYEREVRRKVITHCTLAGSTTVPGGMVLVSIIIDIERIGDYTKNIVDLAMLHPAKLKGGAFEDDLEEIERAVKDNFVRTRKCIEKSQAKCALQLLNEYEWVSKACDKALQGLVEEKDKDLPSSEAVSVALYIRWLKRINAHLRNITTSVVNPFDRIGYQPEEDQEVE